MSISIESFLKQFRGQEVFFCPNPGNAGDSLINAATYQLFRKIGINYRILSGADDLEGKIVFYGGGGNFVSYYNNASDFISKWHHKASRMVILPSTIDSHMALISGLGPNVDVICREKVSFNYVNMVNRDANVHLMDDMGFYFDVRYFRDWNKLQQRNFRSRINRKLLKFLAEERSAGSGALNSFRLDKESTEINVPEDNVDIARLLEAAEMDEEAAAAVAYNQLFFINLFDQVNTNRLHVCISGILLGKKVNFFPNSYYKNLAVYEHSMKKRFARVVWMGEE